MTELLAVTDQGGVNYKLQMFFDAIVNVVCKWNRY